MVISKETEYVLRINLHELPADKTKELIKFLLVQQIDFTAWELSNINY